ncbi:MAG: class I SAM-dependent methyltransferase [Elusimicrobia bacterium]|nr:class I SAM-dependent methyltransferase [Candidatus Obscuribacterium magneticum]
MPRPIMKKDLNALYRNRRFLYYFDVVRSQGKDFELFARHLHKTDDILDVACGTGTLALAVREKVNSVTAFDLSKEMIERAAVKAKKLWARNVNFFRADMRRFDIPRRFDCIIMGNSIILEILDPEAQIAFARRLNRHLKPNGKLLFTTIVFSKMMLENNYYARTITDPTTGNQFTVSYDNELDLSKGIWKSTLLFRDLKTDVEDRFPLRLSILSRREIFFLMALGGFRIEREREYQKSAGMSFFVCRKTA